MIGFPRNPLIADVCYKAGYIDSWGRGVEKIVAACEQAGLPAPKFEERSDGVAVELVKSKSFKRFALKETSEKIIVLIQEDAFITIKKLAEYTGVTTRSVERNLKKLQDNNKIKRVGPDKGGHWKVLE